MPRNKPSTSKPGGTPTNAIAASSAHGAGLQSSSEAQDVTQHEAAGPSQHWRRASTNADHDSPEEIEVVKGPRQAKTNALQNQVWIMADGSSAARKKLSGSSQPEQQPGKKRRTKEKPRVPQTPHSNDDPEKENCEPVSLPVPSAPKKPKPVSQKKGSASAGSSQKSANDDPFTDEGSTATSSIQSLSNEETGSNFSAEEQNEDAGSNANRPAWSNKLGILKSPFVIKSPPSVIGKKRKHDVNGNESPTEHLVSESRQRSKGKARDKVLRRRRHKSQPAGSVPNVFTLDGNEDGNESDVSRTTEPVWPEWTNIVRSGPNGPGLTNQAIEMQLVLRHALGAVEERFVFEDSFPGVIARNTWNRHAVRNACGVLERGSQALSVKAKYRIIFERAQTDVEYIKDISALLDPRISIYRGNAKIAATNNIKLYGIFESDKVDRPLVNDLIYHFNYVYVQKGRDYDKTKGYEHPAIIEVLRAVYFTRANTITTQYPHRFDLEDKGTRVKVEPSMVALAATSIHSALDEWRDGVHRQVKFHINTYTNVYRDHMKALEHIRTKNKAAYDVLLRKLFRRARASIQAHDVISLLDVDHMEVQDEE